MSNEQLLLQDLTSYQRAAVTKRARSLDEFIQAGAREFAAVGYGAASPKDIAALTSRSEASFYNVVKRRSRLGTLVLDATFPALMEARADGGRDPLHHSIEGLRLAFRQYPGIERALVEEAIINPSLRESMPGTTAHFDEALETAFTSREITPDRSDLRPVTDTIVPLVASLTEVTGLSLEASDLLIETYVRSVSGQTIS